MLGVVGDLIEDVVVWLDEPLQPATDTSVSMLFRTRGGSAANVAAFAGRRYPTRFLGCVGIDPVGDSLVSELSSHGVDVKVQRRGATGTIVVIVDEQGERIMLPHRGASVLLSDVEDSWLTDIEHLHVPGYSLVAEPLASTSVELVRRVQETDGSSSVDAASIGILRKYGIERFLELVADLTPKFLFANRAESELLGLTSDGELTPAVERLPRTVMLLKAGADPTTVVEPGEASFQVAVPPLADVQDLTGAGDAFAAGFLASTLRGAGLRAACEAGHSAAALAVQAPGASAHTT